MVIQKRKNVVRLTILSLAILFALCIVSLPSFFSTHFGKEILLSILNQSIPGQIRVKTVSVSWLGPQKIEEVELLTLSGSKVASFDTFTLETAIWNLPKKENWFKGSLNNLRVDVKELPVDHLDTFAASSNPQLSGLFRALFGETLNVNIQTEASSYSIDIHSPFFQWQMKGILEENKWVIQTPGKALLSLSPEVLNKILLLLDINFKEVAPIESSLIELQWGKIEVPVNFFQAKSKSSPLEQAIFDIVLTLPKMAFAYSNGKQIALEGFNIALKAFPASDEQLPAKKDSLELYVQGALRLNHSLLPFSLALDSHMPSHLGEIGDVFAQPNHLHFSLEKVGSSSLDAIFGTSEIFSKLLGSKVTFHLHSSIEDPQAIALQLRSDDLRIPQCTLKVHQQFHLGEGWQEPEISGEFFADRIVWKEPFPKDPSVRSNTVAQGVRVPWKLNLATKEMWFSWNGQFGEMKESAGLFKGDVYASVDHLNRPIFKSSFQGGAIPSVLFEWATGKNFWKALFGPTLAVEFMADLKGRNAFRKEVREIEWEQGPISLDLAGNLGGFHLQGKVDQSTLTLLSPLEWTMTPSESLGREVLGEWIPAFNALIGGDRLIRLAIQPQGFSFPMNTSLEKLQIGDGRLDLGILYFHNTDLFKQMLQLLKAEKTDKVSFWTTPLYFNVNKGVLELFRTDLLVLNRYPLATWGKIDWPQDQVNMVLGVSSEALFGSYPLALGRNEMVQIPLTGSIYRTKVDSSQVTRKIGSLLAKMSGSREGLLLGVFLDLAAKKEGKVPSPTTYPFPWEDAAVKRGARSDPVSDPVAVNEGEARSVSKEKSAKKKNRDLLKEKGSQLLKSLFK